ncbi:MAG: HEAT repeat domain-containing protein [Chloroflexi bacterium]|nr:HEAT repeat domain-containing protein [Chloroflexota bacterium]
MKKTDAYRAKLKTLENWDTFLSQESGLPGPRGNLELAQAVADEGTAELFERYIKSPDEYLAVCGAIGLGRLVAEGQRKYLRPLRALASDSRWRVREGVAMALQRVGDQDMDSLLREMKTWSQGNPLEQRAAAAALCEPRLLSEPQHVQRVVTILDDITASIANVEDRKSPEFIALRKGLGYCWSVAVAALPAEGKRRLEKWFSSRDADVLWIMRENLKEDRLARMDAAWVARWQKRLAR